MSAIKTPSQRNCAKMSPRVAPSARAPVDAVAIIGARASGGAVALLELLAAAARAHVVAADLRELLGGEREGRIT